MNKKTMIKYGSILFFILIAGLFYSCKLKEQAIITLGQEELEKSQKLEASETLEEEEAEILDILEKPSKPEQSIELEDADYSPFIYVHVCGSVKNPDVYKVKKNSRIADVIQLAGGLKEEAADSSINQASIVIDGQQIYVPSKEEFSILKDSGQQEIGTEEKVQKNRKLNINKASINELMTLPGIGKSKAESILAFREDNGRFTSIEDIMLISGIKENVFNKIKDLIDIK